MSVGAFERSSIGKGFYILEKGELEGIRDDKILNEINLKGAMFGELSELLMIKRDASIAAKTDAVVKYFDMGLDSFVEDNPRFAVKIIRNLGRRLCRMNAVALKGKTSYDFLRNLGNASTDDVAGRAIRLLVVEDKSMIINQIKDSVSSTGWEIDSAESAEDALGLCVDKKFSAILISCSLPDETALELRRKLKTNPKSSKTPIVGILIKGDDNALKSATDSGFSSFIYKPIEKNSTLTTLYEVLSLDASDQYFEKFYNSWYDYYTQYDGIENIVIDLSKLDEAGEDSVELVGEFAELIEEIGSPFKLAFVVEGEDAEMWKNLDGCEAAEIFESLEDAKSQMS